LLTLVACADAQPRVIVSNDYNVPNIGGAGLSPIGEGGLSYTRALRGNGPVPTYNVPQSGGAGLLPSGLAGLDLHPAALRPGPAYNYNLPDSGGAGLLPIDAPNAGARTPSGR